MSQAKYRKKEYYKNCVCHIYNRGVNKEFIFLEDSDFIKYIVKLKEFKSKYNIDIIAYSLLNNHYHLLLEQLSDISLNKFLLAVNTSYGQYFNKRYKRIGPLMQDRFKQSILKDKEHFCEVSVYVNCNYEIHGIGSARNYKWSSYQDYLGLRNGVLCNKTKINKYFAISKKYEEYCISLIPKFQEIKINN